MGRASRRKQQRWADREAERSKFKVVVFGYPEMSLEPMSGLLKAAVLYGDDVILHHPLARYMADTAAFAAMEPGDFLRTMGELAPMLGSPEMSDQLEAIRNEHGDAGVDALGRFLDDPSSGAVLKALGASNMGDGQTSWLESRQQLVHVIEQLLDDVDFGIIIPALEAGRMTLGEISDYENFIDAYMSTVWSTLKDPAVYPIMDERIAEIVNLSVLEGAVDLSQSIRRHGREVGAASEFARMLPSFPNAGMDEILDVRSELRRPLSRFRAEMAEVARLAPTESFDPDFREEAKDHWKARVVPALLELDELVEEKRLRNHFSQPVDTVAGILAGVFTGNPLVAAGSAMITGTAVELQRRKDLNRQIEDRPYYFLYETEKRLDQSK